MLKVCFNVIKGVANVTVLGQVVTSSQTNCNIALSSTQCHVTLGRQSAGKVPSTVNRMAINKCFVINIIMLMLHVF